MIGIGITFDLGRYHANPWRANANEALTEWPPSPWRLLRALYATTRTNLNLADQVKGADRALSTLLSAPPPAYELPLAKAAHSRHYVPEQGFSLLGLGKRVRLLDGFLALDAEAELRVWWDAELDEDARDVLADVTRRLGYLGRSESVCTARLLSDNDRGECTATPIEADADVADGKQVIQLICPSPDASLEKVMVSVTAIRKARQSIPVGAQMVAYALDAPTDAVRITPRSAASSELREAPTLALFSLRGGNRPAITDAVSLGDSLRRAVQSAFGRMEEEGESTSATFSGRMHEAPRCDQHRHAHFIALPSAASSRVDRLVAWAPGGFTDRELRAMACVSKLYMSHHADPLDLALAATGQAQALHVPMLTAIGASRHWRSLTPFGLTRHPKRRAGGWVDLPEQQIEAELERRGLPAAVEVKLIRGSWHRFRSQRLGQTRFQRARVVGAEVTLAEPYEGPLVIGALCHYGLGVFQPVESPKAVAR